MAPHKPQPKKLKHPPPAAPPPAPATPPPPPASPPAPPLDNSLSSLNFNPPAPPSPAPPSAMTLVSSPCLPPATDTLQPVSVMQTPAAGQKRPSEESNTPSAPKCPKQLPGKHVNNAVDLTKATKKSVTLKEKLAVKDQEILAEKAKSLAAQAKLMKLLECERSKKRKEDEAVSTLILKPLGQAGHGEKWNGYRLIEAMGLKDQKELFNNMNNMNITEHPPALLSTIYKQVKEKSPQLAAFDEDWPT
ncbi:hypothetical protein DACRYDRAFT_106781 [Dacryopinax primogenitus]|uniref:Uncharacterized protein n=1 Tax=Dacryopinax primogenitus (strain DJM 731) TaxID=1858805 RepID=M5G201_DACPD|nr:uncharacterized protein DACRYDRAFT_106781 [Dacryopinax primogenitus]EJU02719.1 hypothetical protein DACRYDRAFT_106781 [Dacryopinax primogenitus]